MKKIKVVLSLVLALLMLVSSVPFAVSASEQREGDWSYTILANGTVEISYYSGMSSEVTIPSEINGMSVTSIGNSSFSTHHVTSIIIPDTVKNIGFSAFSGCYNLKKLTIGKGVETIHKNAWSSSKLETIIVDKDNAYFSNDEYGVLYNKEKTTLVKYPEENKRKEYKILDSVKVIGYKAFESANYLESVIIPNSVKTIEISAFAGAKLKEIKIPNSVKTIADTAFMYCQEEELIIPESVIEIGEGAFESNDELISVTIGKNVKTIKNGAFAFNVNLTEITVDSENKYFSNDENGILFNKDKTKLIQYPLGNRKSAYAVPDGVNFIGESAFRFPSSSSTCHLTYLIIPNSVTIIGEKAFYFFGKGSTGTYVTNVYYKGSRSQWNNIVVEDGNEYLEKATIHFDENSDGFCDDCGDSYDKDFNCSHICHKENAFYKKFLYPMLCFFWELFRINKYCECGMVHYN